MSLSFDEGKNDVELYCSESPPLSESCCIWYGCEGVTCSVKGGVGGRSLSGEIFCPMSQSSHDEVLALLTVLAPEAEEKKALSFGLDFFREKICEASSS